MLIRLIEDMNLALDHDCWFSALALALTLPDICGKAMCPEEKSGKKRYITWYDEYVGKYEQCPGDEGETPYLSGEVVYQLRCAFLHQGNPNINTDKITENCCKIDHFSLAVDKKKEFNFLMDSACSSEHYFQGKQIGKTHRCYEVNVRRLCFIIAANAEAYYNKHKDQFGFFNFSIVDLDERHEKFEKLKSMNIL